MESTDFFSNMTFLNKVSLGLFFCAKMSGLVGVILGFAGPEVHKLGTYILGLAFVFIFSSIVCSLIQFSKDEKRFSVIDEENRQVKKLLQKKAELENQLKDLEFKKENLKKLLMTK
jgi:Na+/melibiose symporter-like transporter